MELKCKYAKRLYHLILKCNEMSRCSISIEDFRKYMGIPKYYKMGNIDQKILSPALDELRAHLHNLSVDKIKDGCSIVSLQFRWNTNTINPISFYNIILKRRKSMKKLSILLAAVILAVAALISGCGSSVADEFVGTWVSNNGYTYISIEKKGTKNFIINRYFYDKKNNSDLFKSNTGELKGEILEVEHGFYTIKENKIVESDNNIYNKVKDKALSKEELQELAKSK